MSQLEPICLGGVAMISFTVSLEKLLSIQKRVFGKHNAKAKAKDSN